MTIKDHKFIIFGTYAANTLGQIRNGGIKDAIGGIIFLFTMLPLLFAGTPAGFLATTKIRESKPMVVLKCFVPIGTIVWFGLNPVAFSKN